MTIKVSSRCIEIFGLLIFTYSIVVCYQSTILLHTLLPTREAGLRIPHHRQQRKKVYANAFDQIKQELPFPYVPISVLIPAVAYRLNTIPRLLESIVNGTRLPQEVILAVSDVKDPINISIPSQLNVTIVSTEAPQMSAANRNMAARHAKMPVFAYIDSDDIAGPLWLETVFYIFSSFENVDAMLHKWFSCRFGISPEAQSLTQILPTRDRLLIANEIFPSNLSDVEAKNWVAGPKKVNETNQLFDKGFNHPWLQVGHVSVKRNVYLKVQQREGYEWKKGQDSQFIADLMLQDFQVIFIENYLTGYCKH